MISKTIAPRKTASIVFGILLVIIMASCKNQSDSLLIPFLPETEENESVTVFFDANGGNLTTAWQKVEKDVSTQLMTAEEIGLSRSGYVFFGWSEDSAGNAVVYWDGDLLCADNNITVYAVWLETVEITFEMIGTTVLVYNGKTLVSWKPMEGDVSFDSVLILRDGAVVAEVPAEKSGCAIAENRAGAEYALAVRAGAKISEKRIAVTSVEPGLPVIEVTTVDGEEPTCSYRSAPAGEIGAGIYDATKVPGRLVMTSGTETLYDSGDYLKSESGMTIKIRGNTSAYSAKKPYKIKLQKKADLLAGTNGRSDKKFKDKNWILLKDGTSLNTFVGMTVADIAGTEWTPEFAFVNLIVNDNFRGTYLLIEAISQSEGRINIDEDTGYIIERDAYWWNEQMEGNPTFKTTILNRGLTKGYSFKHPDEDDITETQIEYIEDYMNKVETSLLDGTYNELIDNKTFARWLLVHDMLGTKDYGGSNMYITKYSNDDSKIKMSTPWDFDSNFGMKDAYGGFHTDYAGVFYMSLLLTSENTEFLRSYKTQWADVKGSVQRELSAELSALQARLGDAINASRRLDATRWGGTYTSVEANITTAENWFATRIPWLETNIEEIPLSDE